MNVKKLARDTAIVVLITLGLVVGTELALRLVFPAKTYAESAPADPAYAFNERYLISLKPGVEKQDVRAEENGGDTIDWVTNADAMRGADLADDPQVWISHLDDRGVVLGRAAPVALRRTGRRQTLI